MQAAVDARGIWLSLLIGLGALVAEPRISEACGCLSPPAVDTGDYAVNQRAEQIIFEVEPGWVTAHVLIKYAGKPESFAWIIPVPEVPELAISPVSAFGLIDRATAPDVSVSVENICPISKWQCQYHDSPSCGQSDWGADGNGAPGSFADAGAGGSEPPPVTVIAEQVVGDYQTVTFRANEAQAATQWLRDNGFIVNHTTSIYMEPYVQAGMVFIAAKLVPGAGIASIKPLKMKYRAAFPMIPLLLTAVAAEPHLTVTTFIYGNDAFRPMGHPVVTIDPRNLARDSSGRLNYPSVLSRAVDDAGGDGFAIEYRGNAVYPDLTQGQGGNCCSNGYDFCNIGGNDQCECPRADFDREDCEAEGDLLDGIALLDDLSERYTTLTRITTRVSPEEMTFDPTFEREFNAPRTGRMQVRGSSPSLAACTTSVIDQDRFERISALQSCATLYCGVAGHCVTTETGAACECMPGSVAQRFVDLDGVPSVTCVPRVPTVDLRAGGEVLPDACAGIDCGTGSCLDRNGVAVCECAPGTAAAHGGATANAPRCEPLVHGSQSRGAGDYSEPLRGLDVCAARPPTCYEGGWLEDVGTARPGVACGNIEPPAALTTPGPKPTCGLLGLGCGGCQQSEAPVPAVAGIWIVGALLARRRRRARRS